MKIDRKKVYELHDGRCGYCGNRIDYSDMQVDHIIPKSRWYMTYKDINDPSNLMPSCRLCNHYKRVDTVNEYRNKIKTLHERLNKIYIYRVALRYGMVSEHEFSGKFKFEEFEENE